MVSTEPPNTVREFGTVIQWSLTAGPVAGSGENTIYMFRACPALANQDAESDMSVTQGSLGSA